MYEGCSKSKCRVLYFVRNKAARMQRYLLIVLIGIRLTVCES